MKKCLYFEILFINIIFLSVILSDKTIQGKKIKKVSLIYRNKTSIASNVQFKKNFIEISINNLITMEFNSFSISIKTKYYYLLKFMIHKYLNTSYFDEALDACDVNKSFYEFIFFHYNIINNSVLIDVNIYFYKSKNSSLNKNFLIFSKNYFIFIPNYFREPYFLIMYMYRQYTSTFSYDLNYLYDYTDEESIKEYNDLLGLIYSLKKSYINFTETFLNLTQEFFEIELEYLLYEKGNKMNYFELLTNLCLNEINKIIIDFELLTDLFLNEINKIKIDFELSTDLCLNEINKIKTNYFELLTDLRLNIINGIKTNNYEQLIVTRYYLDNNTEKINSNLYSYQNNTETINSNNNSQIIFDMFLFIISLINLIYSYNISVNKEKISSNIFSAYIFAISFFFHFCFSSIQLFILLYELFKEHISLTKNTIINILNINSSIINTIFDSILISYFDGYCVSEFIIAICLIWTIYFVIDRPLNFFLVFESSTWVIQIIQNFYFKNKKTYPLFFIINFISEKLLIISFLYISTKYPFPSKEKIIIILIINISNIVILNIQPFLINKFMLGSKKEKYNNKLTVNKEELLLEKPNVKNEICAICLGQILITKNKYNGKINYKRIKKIFKTIIKKIFYIYSIYKSNQKRDYILIPCGHFFHKKCSRKWIRLKKKCPLCRQTFK